MATRPTWRTTPVKRNNVGFEGHLVTTRLVGFVADGLHPYQDNTAITNFAGGDGPLMEPLPYHSDVRCRLEHTERLGRTLERDAAAAEGEPTGCATCVNTGEQERNAKIFWQREKRDWWFKTDEDRELRSRSINGLVAETPLAGCARAKNIVRDVIDGSSIVQGSSNQCQQF